MERGSIFAEPDTAARTGLLCIFRSRFSALLTADALSGTLPVSRVYDSSGTRRADAAAPH